MYNDVLNAHEEPKDLEKVLKDLVKEVQVLNKEKEVAEKRQREALKKQTELELDLKDQQERISGNVQAKDDAEKQLDILFKEIEYSSDIRPLYEEQDEREKEITKGKSPIKSRSSRKLMPSGLKINRSWNNSSRT